MRSNSLLCGHENPQCGNLFVADARIEECPRAAREQHRLREPWARSSRSILAESALPIPRRRCDGSTCMFAHHIESSALTLRTQPTIFSPSSATYWRNGASAASCSGNNGFERVALANSATIAGDFSRQISAGPRGLGILFILCTNSGSVPNTRYPNRLYAAFRASPGSSPFSSALTKKRPRVYCRAIASTYCGSTPYATHSSFR